MKLEAKEETGPEVKQAIIDWLRLTVFEREDADGREAVVVTYITPT